MGGCKRRKLPQATARPPGTTHSASILNPAAIESLADVHIHDSWLQHGHQEGARCELRDPLGKEDFHSGTFEPVDPCRFEDTESDNDYIDQAL